MNVLRWFLAIVALLVFMVFVQRTISRYLSVSEFARQYTGQTPKTLIRTQPYNDMTDGSIQARLTLSNNLFQATLLITAALAGLLIAKDREARFILAKGPEIMMFVCTGLLLLLSLVSHALYLTEISYIYALAGKFHGLGRIADVFDDNINFLLSYQVGYVIAGAILAFLTFLSAYKLKGGGTE